MFCVGETADGYVFFHIDTAKDGVSTLEPDLKVVEQYCDPRSV